MNADDTTYQAGTGVTLEDGVFSITSSHLCGDKTPSWGHWPDAYSVACTNNGATLTVADPEDSQFSIPAGKYMTYQRTVNNSSMLAERWIPLLVSDVAESRFMCCIRTNFNYYHRTPQTASFPMTIDVLAGSVGVMSTIDWRFMATVSGSRFTLYTVAPKEFYGQLDFIVTGYAGDVTPTFSTGDDVYSTSSLGHTESTFSRTAPTGTQFPVTVKRVDAIYDFGGLLAGKRLNDSVIHTQQIMMLRYKSLLRLATVR